MNHIKCFLFSITIILINSCASRYQPINPKLIDYHSSNKSNDVLLEYRYDLLDKKYAKKESKKGMLLVALKITNNSNRNLVFGKDIKLTYENNKEIYVMDNNTTFKKLKQSPATHLLYLLLTPVNLYTTKANSYEAEEQTSSIPIGLILGPALAAGNMITAGSANQKFNSELLEYNINGTTINKGETVYGLIGITSSSYNHLKLKIE